MSQKFIQAQKFYLSGSGVTNTATSIGLQSFKLPDGTNITTASHLGTLNYGTLEPGTEREEIISFTGVTQNADGSATLTGVTRGLQFASDYTADNDLRQEHAGNTVFVLSNNPQVYEDFASLSNAESITGVWTFDESTGRPRLATDADTAEDTEFVSLGQLNRTALGTTITNRLIVAANAGETVGQYKVVYFDETENEWMLADANAAGKFNGVKLALTMGTGTDGSAITPGVLLMGEVAAVTGFTAGDPIYLSDTAGEISSTPGTNEIFLGYVKPGTTDTIYFIPRALGIPTSDEKNALAGNDGTPSTSNKYVTQSGYQNGAEVFAASSAGSDTYAITLSPAPSAYTTGMRFFFTADVANTGACTLNVNSLGAITIKKNVSDDLEDGDIAASQISEVIYDGTNFQLVNTPNGLVGGGFTSAHKHPAMVQQLYGGTSTDRDNVICVSNSDGSIIIAIYNKVDAGGTMPTYIHRYAKETTTGIYYRTHVVSGQTIANAGGKGSYPVILGDYVYQVYESGTNVVSVYRYDLADLTNGASITLSGGSLGVVGYNVAFTDGTDFYIQANQSGAVNQYTVSGTTFTYDSQTTFDADMTDARNAVVWADSTNLWSFNDQHELQKYTISNGTQVSSTTYGQFGFGNEGFGSAPGSGICGLVYFDDNTFLFAHGRKDYTDAAEDDMGIVLFPFLKS